MKNNYKITGCTVRFRYYIYCIETGRLNEEKKLCLLFNLGEIEDEVHLIFIAHYMMI